jgi:lambda family phage tail tape measure protein
MAQSLIRHALAFLELQPYIILAGIEAAAAVAGTPFIGPILAPIAAATTIAALEGLAVFSEGGYTGDGGQFDPAGVVHRGEFVFSQAAVNRIGLPVLDAMHNGAGSTGGGAHGPGAQLGSKVSVYSYTDPRLMQQHLERNDDHEKYVVDVMRRNMHRFS